VAVPFDTRAGRLASPWIRSLTAAALAQAVRLGLPHPGVRSALLRADHVIR